MLPQHLMMTIKDDLMRHEGYVPEIYLDSEGLPTFGIGHLVTKDDLEYGWEVGTPVSKTRIAQVFEQDLEVSIEDAQAVFKDFIDLPETVQRILVNMAFNLGRTRLRSFKKMIAAVEAGDYQKAADEMVDSRWYRQVGVRSKELVKLMRNV